jgi:hypothetical protein
MVAVLASPGFNGGSQRLAILVISELHREGDLVNGTAMAKAKRKLLLDIEQRTPHMNIYLTVSKIPFECSVLSCWTAWSKKMLVESKNDGSPTRSCGSVNERL